MSQQSFEKDPDERLDYDFDFERWLPDGDSVDSAVAEIAGTTAVIDQIDTSSTAIKVWVSGGTHQDNGTITVRATTVQGRIKEVCARLKVRNC